MIEYEWFDDVTVHRIVKEWMSKQRGPQPRITQNTSAIYPAPFRRYEFV